MTLAELNALGITVRLSPVIPSPAAPVSHIRCILVSSTGLELARTDTPVGYPSSTERAEAEVRSALDAAWEAYQTALAKEIDF